MSDAEEERFLLPLRTTVDRPAAPVRVADRQGATIPAAGRRVAGPLAAAPPAAGLPAAAVLPGAADRLASVLPAAAGRLLTARLPGWSAPVRLRFLVITGERTAVQRLQWGT